MDQPPAPRPRDSYALAGSLFLRALAVVYLMAFVSLAVQIRGLAGANGILPAAQYLEALGAQVGPERYWHVPTLFWLTGASDGVLVAACWAGAAVALMVACGFLPLPGLIACFALYLSLSSGTRTFLNFQWDILLTEAGLLALFVAPWRLRAPVPSLPAPAAPALWLVRWLLFRLMFSSGVVKLTSGDPTWWNLRALDVHYFTQPIPTWTAWFVHQLPAWFHTFECGVMFCIELVVPFGLFAPRPVRRVCALILFGFQAMIAATGNYAFFNYLTMALCLVLFDDAAWPAWLRRRLPATDSAVPARRWPLWVSIPVLTVFVTLTTAAMTSRWDMPLGWPSPVEKALTLVRPLRIINAYGLFAVMTTTRQEIVVEGSDDGQNWSAYEFKWKPGDVSRRPGFVAPHQPRLDWQMWFAALSSYRQQPWFANFLGRLLQGSPEVLALLEKNPFPDRPPRYIRSVVYDYRFSDFGVRRESGAWWVRTPEGQYSPVQSLRRAP
ncbi:MAG TPA: lipase maturation factor family protein [Candidatus Polarisedimenticolia bacterium]|nr:lipase maturation factor family protein [Candidatus Polarisedimenticolia bacterium]